MLNTVIKYRRKLFSQAIFFIVTSAITIILSGATYAVQYTDGLRTYQNMPRLSDEHKQNIADDITRFKQADNLWDVLRDEFSLQHYENNPLVQEKIEWFMNNQDFLLRSVTRASPYLHYILQQVKKRHLPAELVLLPIVESGYNPFATSNVGAAGIWQLMPGTATGLGVQQDWWYDGRRDVIASTRAALNYLAYLQSFFDGNWLLAIAAYNTGEGNVLAAIRRNIRDGQDTDFWSLPVAQQTRNYVPSILALAIIISKPNQYPIYFPPVRNAPYLAQFDVRTKMSLKVAASFAGLSYKKLLSLNPGFSRAAATAPYKLVLPIENIEQFSENLVRSPFHERESLGWIHYRMKAGDTLVSVAKKFKTTTEEIRKFNHLVKANPHRGTNLLIPEAEPTKLLANTETIAKPQRSTLRSAQTDNGPIASRLNRRLAQANITPPRPFHLQPGDTVYMVRSNDTLQKIAKRFHINIAMLKAANRSTGPIKPGRNIIIPTHVAIASMPANPRKGIVLPGETIYMVRHGDSIAKIAKRYHVSPSSLRLANLVDDNSLVIGTRLIIPSPIRG